LDRKAPNTHYLGSAWLKGFASEDIDFNITLATFKANSTLDWHKHETGQVLIVVSGKAYYQERGKDAVVLNEGDVIKCDKQVEHWHSATKESDVSYIIRKRGTHNLDGKGESGLLRSGGAGFERILKILIPHF
jgi:quercetin dioxygenase-like cupin family protein